MAADRVSGAAVVVMMVESFIPIGAHFKCLKYLYDEIRYLFSIVSISGLKPWFAMVKLGVMGRDEDCTNGLRYKSMGIFNLDIWTIIYFFQVQHK